MLPPLGEGVGSRPRRRFPGPKDGPPPEGPSSHLLQLRPGLVPPLPLVRISATRTNTTPRLPVWKSGRKPEAPQQARPGAGCPACSPRVGHRARARGSPTPAPLCTPAVPRDPDKLGVSQLESKLHGHTLLSWPGKLRECLHEPPSILCRSSPLPSFCLLHSCLARNPGSLRTGCSPSALPAAGLVSALISEL